MPTISQLEKRPRPLMRTLYLMLNLTTREEIVALHIPQALAYRISQSLSLFYSSSSREGLHKLLRTGSLRLFPSFALVDFPQSG